MAEARNSSNNVSTAVWKKEAWIQPQKPVEAKSTLDPMTQILEKLFTADQYLANMTTKASQQEEHLAARSAKVNQQQEHLTTISAKAD